MKKIGIHDTPHDAVSSLFFIEAYIDSDQGPQASVSSIINNAPENEGDLYHSLLRGFIETEWDSGPVSSFNRSVTYLGTDGNVYHQVYDPTRSDAKNGITTVNFGPPEVIFSKKIAVAVNHLPQREPPEPESVDADYSQYYQ